MDIILLQDVKSLGKKGDVVKVNDGYARNMLLPKKLGVEANSRNMEDLKKQKAEQAQREKEILEEAKALADSIGTKSVTIGIKAGEGGRTFGSVTTKEISTAIKEQLKLDIDKKKLVLSDALKNVGEYSVPIKLHPNVTAQIKVIIKAI